MSVAQRPELRPARSTDAGKIGAILTRFCTDSPWMPDLHSAAEDVAFCGQMIDRGWVTIATCHDAVNGFCARDGEAVNALYVAPDMQRQGIGTALIRHAQSARDRLELWTHQANLPAQAFYAAHGFREVRRTDGCDNQERLPDILYVWTKDDRSKERAT